MSGILWKSLMGVLIVTEPPNHSPGQPIQPWGTAIDNCLNLSTCFVSIPLYLDITKQLGLLHSYLSCCHIVLYQNIKTFSKITQPVTFWWQWWNLQYSYKDSQVAFPHGYWGWPVRLYDWEATRVVCWGAYTHHIKKEGRANCCTGGGQRGWASDQDAWCQWSMYRTLICWAVRAHPHHVEATDGMDGGSAEAAGRVDEPATGITERAVWEREGAAGEGGAWLPRRLVEQRSSLLQNFSKKDDVESYIDMFECVATQQEWPKETCYAAGWSALGWCPGQLLVLPLQHIEDQGRGITV